MTARSLPLALTQGDPSGVGPDITLAAWAGRTDATPAFFVLADPAVLADRAARLGLAVSIAEVEPAGATAAFPAALPVVPLTARAVGRPGQPSVADAAGTLEAIDRAVGFVRHGEAGAIVTNPIAKAVLYRAGFTRPGHTEYLGDLAARLWKGPHPQPVMMLWCEALAVVPVTVHIALASIPAALTRELIENTAAVVAADLSSRFGIERPRLAVAGLNPHAGEGGAMGREEIEIIGPALVALRDRGFDVAGPFPADTLFTAAARPRYDAVLAMYHDQALIPIKTLAFDEAVNVTLGLPFVRTSPDHGTAFDIAGSGRASPTSLVAALRLAGRLATRAMENAV